MHPPSLFPSKSWPRRLPNAVANANQIIPRGLFFFFFRRHCLIAYCGVVQRDTHGASMMAIVLPDDALATQFPQARIVVTARSNQIRAVGAESAIPDPALMTVQCRLEREGSGVTLSRGWQLIAWL